MSDNTCSVCLDEEIYSRFIIHKCCKSVTCQFCSVKLSLLCPICDRHKLHDKVFNCCVCNKKLSHVTRIHDPDTWEDYCHQCKKETN